LQQRPDDRIGGKLTRRLVQVEVEVRDAPGTVDQVHQLLPVRQVGAQQEMVVSARIQFENARVAGDRDGPPIDPVRDRHVLDAWGRSRRQVGHRRVPVERAGKRQPQQQAAVRDQPVGLAALGAQHVGRRPGHLLAGAVELAQAPEAHREGDLGDGEIGVVEQPAGEVRPCRARQPVGRHAQVGHEQATQMPRGHAEPVTELGLGGRVEGAVEDQSHGPAHQLRAGPGHGLRRAVGPAAQAGPVARGLGGGGGQRERPDVVRPRLGPTRRSTVDTGRHDREDGGHRAKDLPAVPTGRLAGSGHPVA
jgi:hypothetical protein